MEVASATVVGDERFCRLPPRSCVLYRRPSDRSIGRDRDATETILPFPRPSRDGWTMLAWSVIVDVLDDTASRQETQGLVLLGRREAGAAFQSWSKAGTLLACTWPTLVAPRLLLRIP